MLVPYRGKCEFLAYNEGSNRNINGDNWYSSVELVDELKNGLIYVAAGKKLYLPNFDQIENVNSIRHYLDLLQQPP